MLRSKVGATACAAALAVLTITLQISSNAYDGDFDANADEPAHVVSSLMVHDYVAGGFSESRSPLAFAEQYYLHYPKVAIGHWPPLFHSALAVWMLAAGRSRAAMLAFNAACETLLVTGVFLWMQKDCGVWIAFLAAMLLATVRFMQMAAATVSPDILLSLLVFGAAALYARYSQTGRRKDLAVFAIAAGLALATHGRGALLLLLPGTAALFLRRVRGWHLVSLILAALLTIVVPVVLFQAARSSPVSVLQHGWWFVVTLGDALSWPAAAIVALGFAALVRSPAVLPRWTVMAALLASGWAFSTFVNVTGADYYLVTAAPAAVVLFAAGCVWLVSRFHGHRHLVLAALTGVTCFAEVSHIIPRAIKPDLRVHSMAGALLRDPRTIWLVAGSATFEGDWIAETALSERRREHIVLRASKVLASSWWSGAEYRMTMPDAAAVEAWLDRAHAGWVITERADGHPHSLQLLTALRENTKTWAEHDAGLAGARIFERTGEMPSGPPDIEIDMRTRTGDILRFP